MIVSMGIGGVTATALMSSRGFLFGKGLMILVTLLSGSAVVAVLGFSPWVWLSVPVMVVMGLSQSHFIVANQTLVQNLVPDTLRGRVTSVWHYEQGLIPMFSGLIGLLATFVGISWAMAGFGLGAIASEPFLPGSFHRHSPVGLGVAPAVLLLTHRQQVNVAAVTPKVTLIERQQPAFPVGQHGRNDVSVVNQLPWDRDLAA